MPYKKLVNNYQNPAFLITFISVVCACIGIWVIIISNSSFRELPIMSLLLGGSLGGIITIIKYSERIEKMYNTAPVVFLSVILAVVIMFFFTVNYYSGFMLGLGFGMLLTLVIGESIM